MRTIRFLPVLVVMMALVNTQVAPTIAVRVQQTSNLLEDPSFEQAASGDWKWQWWKVEQIVYLPGNSKEIDLNNSFFSPSFMPSAAKWDQESGGTSGVAGELSGQQGRKFRAGFYQTVTLTAGSRVRFSVYANGFCVDNLGNKCLVTVRAGIDPEGGTNATACSVQWVTAETEEAYVALTMPEVTVGSAGQVTVFTWGEPLHPYLYNAAYFDEASLVVTDTPSSGTLPPSFGNCPYKAFIPTVFSTGWPR